ncbi:MAG: C4-type zinc ribbon domain-containing protein [Actinomycetota bacterium]|nr:C4-type zinc ribbon domain-containing protein [Actinomycetota bacterium]
MNAEPGSQLRLLELQDRDTHLAQIEHKVRTLPEAARLAELASRLLRLRDEITAAETIAADLRLDQARADADVEQVRERSRRDQELLDAGTINDSKQLQSLQHELGSLARRQRELEDIELEVMERVEGALAAVRQLTGERDQLEIEQTEVTSALAGLMEGITAERDATAAERSAIKTEIPDDLLVLYEKIRVDHDGRGAARLYRGQCEGCRMQLPPSEIEVLRNAAPDAVIRCEDCRRILIRTPESGL